jgi:hypothetical protein
MNLIRFDVVLKNWISIITITVYDSRFLLEHFSDAN